jgi:hypothetical protein
MFEKPLTLTVLLSFLHFILNCMIHFEPQLPSGPCKGIYGGRCTLVVVSSVELPTVLVPQLPEKYNNKTVNRLELTKK